MKLKGGKKQKRNTVQSVINNTQNPLANFPLLVAAVNAEKNNRKDRVHNKSGYYMKDSKGTYIL